MSFPITPALIQRLAQALTQGATPALYPGQNDTFQYADNVDATHPLNLDFILPSNYQRITAARVSFKLRAFRNYIAQTTVGGTNHYHVAASLAAGVANNQVLGFDAANNLNTTGAGGGWFTGTEIPASPDVPTNATRALGPYTQTPHTHQLTLGVFESTVATGISVSLDGTDITAALGGPFNTDQVELDLRRFLLAGGRPAAGYHTLAMTPAGPGRIQATIRLGYTVNPALN